MRRLAGFLILFAAVSPASPSLAVVYVDQNAPGPSHDGVSWDTAFLTIQEGVDAATPNGEVWVADGTYVENVVMGSGVALYGGFLGAEPAGYEAARDQRDFASHVATIDGNQANPCVEMARKARVDGFTVANGRGKLIILPSGSETRGGGFYCYNLGTTGRIDHNVITRNMLGDWTGPGSGIYLLGSSPQITENVITDNGTEGIFCDSQSSPQITGNRIERQKVCGIWCQDRSSPTILRNTVSENGGRYGGIHCESYCELSVNSNLIAGNKALNGGGISCADNSSFALWSNEISYNTATRVGGGVCCTDGSVLYLYSNTISGNSAEDAGGAHVGGGWAQIYYNTISANSCTDVGGGVWCAYSEVHIGNNTISENKTLHGAGGGINCAHSTGRITENAVHHNRMGFGDGSGGGIRISDSEMTVSGNSLTDNSSAGQGGGFSFHGTDVLFSDNTVSGNSAMLGGGGGYITSPGITVTHCVFSANSTPETGGGILIFWHQPGTPRIRDCQFLGNLAEGSGGGIASVGSISTYIANSILDHNQAAGKGGGVWSYYSTVCMSNDVLLANAAREGGGAYGATGNAVVLTNSVVAQNTATMRGGGIYCEPGATAGLLHNDFWLNAPQDYDGCDPGVGDISADPLFADPAAGDYHLTPLSSCVDAGIGVVRGVPYQDFEADPRCCDGNGDGIAVVDIGADERRLEYEPTAAPQEWFVPGWVWFSIPLVPRLSSEAPDVLGFDCTHRLYAWDERSKQVTYYPDDFTDIGVGPSYVARFKIGEHYIPVYEGTQPDLPFEHKLPASGWSWVGVPSTQDICGLDLSLVKGGKVRTAEADRKARDPWLNWYWVLWDPVARRACIMDPFGAGDDEWLHPWFGYRVWSNTQDVTIVFP